MIVLRSVLLWHRFSIIRPKIISSSSLLTVRYQSQFANVEKAISHNLLIFEFKDRILPLIGAIGFFQFIGLNLVAYWSFHLFGTVTARQENLTSNSSIIERAATIVPTNRFRYATNICIVILSSAIFGACIIYPARCIRRLYLLKDGTSIGVITYGFWPGARKFTVSLEEVSARTALQSAAVFHKLQIRNRWLSHLINKREGKFYNKSVYETVIALKRF